MRSSMATRETPPQQLAAGTLTEEQLADWFESESYVLTLDECTFVLSSKTIALKRPK
jgi:hypothetical protein